ncbi:response regulator [Sinomonas halotolerans]|uniref:Transcriptional regulatory protein n=1 Tax=Sinomonas halotolerans TaxID=1644133 RepID=A0ABU9WVD3_9MICC
MDDEPAVAGVHQGFLLARGGFEVVGVAHTAEDAVRLVGELLPDLVLLDIHLPDASGLEVLRSLRGLGAESPEVMVISAARELETVREAMLGGVFHYLVKPFSSQQLHERLSTLADRHAALAYVRDTRGSELDQGSIDRLLAAPSSNGPSRPRLDGIEPPKGLSPTTLRLVAARMDELGASGADASAAEVASGLGLSRVSARRYLEFLAARQLVDVLPRYGTAGRPENRYRWNG